MAGSDLSNGTILRAWMLRKGVSVRIVRIIVAASLAYVLLKLSDLVILHS